ncbi:MAG: bifunctional demethylmenaquinone methyltransferase/2-methoxy-6-polyprenyl-1,4-benzoquinol methylase UbiE [Marinifilaceae bacterium]
MSKKEEVRALFNDIATTYDPLNHILSMGIDKQWRKKAIKMLLTDKPEHILDVACGTGDFALTAVKMGVPRVTGIDISEGMVKVGVEKVAQQNYTEKCVLEIGDSEHIHYEDNKFDGVTVAFGVRNFEHLEKGMTEICRVLKPGKRVIVLEFSRPASFPVKQLYNFYFKNILPVIGGLYSGNRAAYEYLPQSVFKFPEGEAFLSIMKQCGFKEVRQQRVSFGIATIYIGTK